MNASVTFNNHVQTACLPTSDSVTFPLEGNTGVVAGWGNSTITGTLPDHLLNNARVSIHSNDECNSYGYTFSSYSFNYNSQFCAGSLLHYKYLFKFLVLN